ncbi:PPK2 family polyphosphate kinase [Commensalibacter oyaizuii]|uniref:Polyphosphate kinase 2 family protein n=1 Tax=Commensalibacter oyaizuii TaxID=3043873 RepID=A0ABT6PYJ8_9PROT|nr:PPK2 family polyphosphate kinase [Commensalibacter sp. TBRC 16381]MDI2089793.1 polyphosphate kinase 2 family protein [Commensalibacter sp. TBRC 16381]
MDKKSMQELLRTKYRVTNGQKFLLTDYNPSDTGGLSLTKKEAKKILKKRVKRLSELQELLYANAKNALIVALQGMDTSGKDGTIKHVTSGINPQGISVASFKQPGPVELARDYLWRIHMAVPARGKIGIFNRSHYEEVLVAKVHPTLLEKQNLPTWVLNDSDFWKHRYQDIHNFEIYLRRQGIGLVKIFLNISKEEQRQRLLSRLDEREKQWKFSPNDPKERQFWEQYQAAYQEAIAQTATENTPWIIVPADNKWYARLVVVEVLIGELEKFDMAAPQPNPEIISSLSELKEILGEKPSDLEQEKNAKKNKKEDISKASNEKNLDKEPKKKKDKKN